MCDAREDLRLALERLGGGSGVQLGTQHFDSDVPVEQRLVCEVDDAHAPAAEFALHPVVGCHRPLQTLHQEVRGGHFSRGSFGGLGPWRTAPRSGTYSSAVPALAQRSISPPPLMSPRPANVAGK